MRQTLYDLDGMISALENGAAVSNDALLNVLRAVRADLASSQAPVAVKALHWDEAVNIETHEAWRADTVVGMYEVGFSDGWYATLDDWKWEWEPENDPRTYAGPGAAQSACQEHYAQLIRSALVEAPQPAPSVREDDSHAFKNFHRLLCERFGYTHDEKDWRRDQVSLIEWIAKRLSPPQPAHGAVEALRDALNAVAYQPGDCPIVPTKHDDFVKAIQSIVDRWSALAQPASQEGWRPGKVRYSRASKHRDDRPPEQLWKLGDTILVWVNEGDLCFGGEEVPAAPTKGA